MSSAQLDIQPLDEAAEESEAAGTSFALKQQVAERLAAHRARHSRQPVDSATPIARSTSTRTKPRAASIAAAVAERYAHSQSYRAFLAAEAERAIHEAQAAAEVAARSAQAIEDAQNQLLAELEQWTLTPPPVAPPTLVPEPEQPAASPTRVSSAGLTVRLYEDIARPEALTGPFHSHRHEQSFDEDERLALEDEIAFRQSPTFEDPIAPVEIPANLIEFPRQLVASRRARPRIAEGPLREEAEQTHDATQLRIFEVEPAQISIEPVASESVETEWSSILLGALPAYAAPMAEEASQTVFNPVLPIQTASINLRLMATAVDACIILTAFLSFAAVFAITLDKLPGISAMGAINLQTAAMGSAGTLAIMALLYQILFFTFNEATPGMRYARIGLCTFNDENPTRAAMRRRIFSTLLSACPLGLGFLWACLDDDGLGWHDRISRIYQRSY